MSDTAMGSRKPNPLWQMHIQQGNANMRDGFYSEAQAAYIRAMQVAEDLLKRALQKQDDTDAIHEFVISCQNLAEVYCVMGLGEEAERLLLKAHSRALKLMNTENISIRFRTEAYRAFQAAFIELVEFYRQTGCHEKMAETIAESKLHAQQFLQEVYRIFENNWQN